MSKKLKRYRLKINPKSGAVVDFISQVENPAIEVGFLKFKNDESFTISFDYDGTLSTSRGKELAKKLISQGETLYIVSARNDKAGMLNTAKELGISTDHVFATGSNTAKEAKVKELGVSKHYDNNADVVKELGGIGQKFMNDDKMELFGPVLIPDVPIYRNSEKMGEYEVYFTVEDIKEIQMNFMKSGYQNNVNLDHTSKMASSYVFAFFQSSDLVPNPEPFSDLPLGTLYAQMKVEDVNVWNDIKSGKRNGFSIEGVFEYLVEEFEKHYLSTTNNVEIQEKIIIKDMLKNLFRKVFAELAEELEETPAQTEETAAEYTKCNSSDFKITSREVGQKVEVADPNGELAAAPDGAYEFEDGFKFVVKDGLIESIDGQEAPVAAADVNPTDANPEDETTDDGAPEGDMPQDGPDYQSQIDELKSQLEEIKALLAGAPTQEGMQEAMSEIKAEFKSVFEKFAQLPAEPSKVQKSNIVKDENKMKFEQFLSTLRK